MSSYNSHSHSNPYEYDLDSGVPDLATSNGTSNHNNNNNQNSETFLSRIFGLNSIYNQLNENYQYYDLEGDYNPEVPINDINGIDDDDEDNVDGEDNLLIKSAASSSSQQQASTRLLSQQPQRNIKSPLGNNALLNSDPESDLDSDIDVDHQIYITPPAENDINRDRASPKINNDSGQASTKLPFNDVVRKPNDFLKRRTQSPAHELPLYNQFNPSQSQTQSQLLQSQFRKPINNVPDVNPTNTTNNIYQPSRNKSTRYIITPKERALYLWANITNMDEFLNDIYYYYRGRGILNIVLSKLVDLLNLIFILFFTVFLKWGINYNYFIHNFNNNSEHLTLSDLIIPNFFWNNVPFIVKFFLFGFTCYIILRLIQVYFDYNYKLKEIRNFFKYLINIKNDDELMTISWKTIVERLMLLKDYNSLTSTNTNNPNQQHYINDLRSKVRLNAHDIANRIMRKENYMIALINKDILDLSVNFSKIFGYQLITNKSVLTKTLEWNLKLCIYDFIFNHEGHIQPNILKDSHRNQLSKELNSRFKMAALINLLLCPFIVIYFVLLYFFRYFNEYKSNPSSIVGLREYTPYAGWKLREFNELPHFFHRRLQLSIGPANTYINQFPRGFLVINVMNLINFISGSILAVLVIMGLLLEDEAHSFWSFELTEGKSALFYISLFGTIFAVTSTSSSSSSATSTPNQLNNNSTGNELNTFVYDPEASLRYVAQFTHYLPTSWKKKLHTIEVKNEFCDLFSLKIIIILNEILSLILTPFLLWFKVSNNSGAIIDFFREYSVHVDGLGYVCSFAMFNFEEKDKNMMVDINHRKKLKKQRHKMKRQMQLNKTNKKVMSSSTANEMELNNIKSKKRDKFIQSDSEGDDSDNNNAVSDFEGDEYEFDDDLNMDYNQNEKMFRSYMYFLESYGGGGAGSSTTVNKSTANHLNNSTNNIPNNNGDASNYYQDSVHLNGHHNNNGIIVNRSTPTPQNDPSGQHIRFQGLNNSNVINTNGSEHHSLAESYNINYKFDADDIQRDSKKGNKGGFFAIVNQVVKQDFDR
ncbi:autophagy-related protein 9 [Scheffersomyces coipomensis]|uniref:autophagy-related protein 9 n=1 Tax=Scheffersomyces coipomensis TaxID=1788519 RepID=UPI00315CA7C2